jgi:RHS repeat-associated protein
MEYDYEGKRIGKTAGSETTQYVYANGKVITSSSANHTATNIYAGEEAVGAYHGSVWYDHLVDRHGSTMGILKQDGTTAAAYTYSDFGETEARYGSTFRNEICYTGSIYDWETGEYYLNARYYDPEAANFLSQDTYRGDTGNYVQWNLYAYCANDPVNNIDPSGHFVISAGFTLEAGAIVGAFGTISLNFDGKAVSVCGTIGGMVVLTAEVCGSFFINYYKKKKSVSKLKGWGFSTGITYGCGAYLSKTSSIDIGTEGSLEVVDQGSVGVGLSVMDVFYRVSIGKTIELKKWKLKSIGKKKKKFKYEGIKVVAKKKKKSYIFKLSKYRIRFKVKKGGPVSVKLY